MEPHWNRVSKTRFAIGWNQVSKTRFVIIFHHFSVQTPEHSHTQTYEPQPEASTNIRKPISKPIGGDSRTLSHPNIQTPTWDKCKHQKTYGQTHQRRQVHLIGSRKPISDRKLLSSHRQPLTQNFTRVSLILPHNVLSSLCKSNSDRPIAHSNLFFLYSSSLFFVVRLFLSSSSDRFFVLRRQIVGSSSILLLFKYQNRVLETRFYSLELKF